MLKCKLKLVNGEMGIGNCEVGDTDWIPVPSLTLS